MATGPKEVDVKKLSDVELQDLSSRLGRLSTNRALLIKLPDKGRSIAAIRGRVELEIQTRRTADQLAGALQILDLDADALDVHSRRISTYEREEHRRFKPSSSLNREHAHKPDHDPSKFIEDARFFNRPTKLIHLPESMRIMRLREDRVQDELTRSKRQRQLDKLRRLQEETEKRELEEHYGEEVGSVSSLSQSSSSESESVSDEDDDVTCVSVS